MDATFAFALFCSGKIRDCFIAPIQRQFTYMCCFNSNITELETQLKKLEITIQGVQLGVDIARANVRLVGPTVENWLSFANEVITEVEGIFQDKAKVKEGCLNGWCPNLKLRYSLSRKAVKKTTVVVDLWKHGYMYTQSYYNPPPASLETLPNRDFMGFESRRPNRDFMGVESRRLIMEEIMKDLKHDEINLIGVSGMEGVGKTTMVIEVAKRAKEGSLFEEFAMAMVGQVPILTNVQDCIADMLGLKELREMKSSIVRANLLRKRLEQDNKKVLVILDDIWAEFDLQAMGIPLGGANKNFKMLYTSRCRDLWHDVQTKKEISLGLLSEEEAWQLFRGKAGDLADDWDLQPIAKQIVHECGHLPLPLLLIGGALSKKRGNWEGMLDRLTCARSTPAVYSSLELSYEFLEDMEARRLFLLCCLFQEDEDIRIEDLARYGFGLSLFDGTNEVAKVRRRVFEIVDDLKSRYLLLDSEKKECVKVQDVVRNMGISIASKDKYVFTRKNDKYAVVSHGAISKWPKTVTHEHYIAISVISEEIKELPEGLTYQNLEFLMLRCHELEKLTPDFFEGMGKLKVLELKNFHGILTFQPLKDLTTLALEVFRGKLDNVRVIGDLLNLEILSFRNSEIKELPEEIRGLVKLRLLDLSGTNGLERIPPGVLACLVRLEELYVVRSNFEDWEGEGQKEGRNANLKEFESLSYLNTLEIVIKKHVVVPKLPIFGKLKKYKFMQKDLYDTFRYRVGNTYERQLMISDFNWDTPAGCGGIDMLLRSSDCLFLGKGGCNDLVQLLLQDGIDSLQELKYLEIKDCDTSECLANTPNLVQQPPNATAVFPILEKLSLTGLYNLKEICRGPIPVGSFGQLTEISIFGCKRLGNLFQLPIVGCLTQLKCLTIGYCAKMEEVFVWKEQREDVHVAPNRIEFPKLERLELENLQSLVGFCRGIDQIDFPKLEILRLQELSKVNQLFHNNNNLSSHSEQNDNMVSFLSLFPEKVILPVLEVFEVNGLGNIVEIWNKQSPWLNENTVAFCKLRDVKVQHCKKLMNLGPSNILPRLQNLQKLCIEGCAKIESVFFKDEKEEAAADDIILPQLRYLTLSDMENFRSFFSTKSDAQSLFNSQVILPVLEVFEVNGLGNIVEIWDKQSPWVNENKVDFRKLRDMKVQHCKELMNLFPSNILPQLQNLQKLCVDGCPNIESLVFKNEKEQEAADVNTLVIPQLRYLTILDMENLKSFYSSSIASTAQSLFNYQVILPVLEVFEINGLGNIVEIWDKQSPWVNENKVDFRKLRDMKVQHCKELMNLFPSNILPQLQNLQKLCVEGCPNIESLVFKNEKEQEVADVNTLVISQLRYLTIRDMENLKSFYSSSIASTAQSLFNYQVQFPRLENLELDGLQNMDNIWGSEYLTKSLSKLKCLKAKRCVKLKNIFRPSMARDLVNLQELIINDCSKMEAVVDGEKEIEDGQGRKIYETLFPNFTKLELRHLSTLGRFCNFTHPFKLPLLSQMVIEDSPRLNAFSSGSVSTPNLLSRDLSCDFVDDDTTVTEDEEPS